MRSVRQGFVAATGVAPPGGDSVTMEQLMKTMHAIQEAVVASRVEIAASHADNEELRKTNEELHIDL